MDPDVDIQKFAEKLARVGRDAVLWERKKLAWILEEKLKQKESQQSSNT